MELISRLVRDRSQYDDAVATIRRSDAFDREAAAQARELRAESALAVRRLRRLGWTFGEIAIATGLTPREVGDLARETRRARVAQS